MPLSLIGLYGQGPCPTGAALGIVIALGALAILRSFGGEAGLKRLSIRSLRISIRNLLVLSSGGLVLAATAALLWVALGVSTRNTFELLNDRIMLILDGIESEVRDKLDTGAGLVEGIANEMKTEHFHAISREEILDTFTVLLATASEVEVLLYWDKNFVRHGVARLPDGTYFRLKPEAGIDARMRESLETLDKKVPFAWGEPVEDDGVTFLNVVSGVDSTKSDVAYVGAAVSLNQFSRFVAEIGANYDATAFILYGDSSLLAHPDLAGSEEGMTSPGVVPIAEASDPVIANLDTAKPAGFINLGKNRVSLAAGRQDADTKVEHLVVDGTDYLVLLRGVTGYGDVPITVGAYYRQSQFSDVVQRLLMSAIVGVGIAMLAVIVAIVLGRFISRPVRRLADSAAAIGRLDLENAPRPTGSAIRELDDQARAFNVMLDGLKVFETYVPRQLVERLIALGGNSAIASETREVTVMFTDIVGFTAISDHMGAEETAAFLNRHFGLLANCIREESGSIDKYIGDAVMAFWGAPDRMDDHPERAVAAARRIAETITADNWRRARKGLKPVRVRIGLHSGEVVVGNIGAPGRVNYTIVGDTVNVAQRIEALGHKLDDGSDVVVLMSAETARLAAVGADGESVGAYELAGVSAVVPVVRLHTHLQPTVVDAGIVQIPAK